MVDLRAKGLSGDPEPLRASVQGGLVIRDVFWEFVGSQYNLSVTGSQIALTRPAAATLAVVEIRTAPIYWVHTPSSTASATVGQSLAIDGVLYLWGKDQINGFRMVRQGGTSAAAFIHYYRERAYDEP